MKVVLTLFSEQNQITEDTSLQSDMFIASPLVSPPDLHSANIVPDNISEALHGEPVNLGDKSEVDKRGMNSELSFSTAGFEGAWTEDDWHAFLLGEE